MKIELTSIRVRDLVAGYTDNEENGVVGYGGKLDIRPKYQRQFVYKPAQRNAVLDTVRKGFPLNVMYWVRKADGTFEVLDGQQRTLSICPSPQPSLGSLRTAFGANAVRREGEGGCGGEDKGAVL